MGGKLKVNELFSGIGAQHRALKKIGIDYEIVGISDIDKYANQSYEAIHGKAHQYGDISKVERLEYADLWTYSFPCTDISQVGRQEGLKKGRTRVFYGKFTDFSKLQKKKECFLSTSYLRT